MTKVSGDKPERFAIREKGGVYVVACDGFELSPEEVVKELNGRGIINRQSIASTPETPAQSEAVPRYQVRSKLGGDWQDTHKEHYDDAARPLRMQDRRIIYDHQTARARAVPDVEELIRLVRVLRVALRHDAGSGASRDAFERACEAEEALTAAIRSLADHAPAKPAEIDKAPTVDVDAIREVIETLSHVDKPYQNAMREKLMASLVSKPSQPAHAAQHLDAIAVDTFAAAMNAKLSEARAKGRSGWQDKSACSQHSLSNMLREHVEKGDPRDVANFCMFLHQRGEAILPRSRSMLELASDPALRRDSGTAQAAQDIDSPAFTTTTCEVDSLITQWMNVPCGGDKITKLEAGSRFAQARANDRKYLVAKPHGVPDG